MPPASGELRAVPAGQWRVQQTEQGGLHVDGGDDGRGGQSGAVLELDGAGPAVPGVDPRDG